MNRRFRLAIIFLFLINLLAGLFFLNDGLFHYDSVVLAQAVENTCKTGILHPAARGRYGAVILGSIIYFPFFILGQNADLAIRLSSVIFHALSVLALFFFVKELFEDGIQAFFAALLLSFTPFYFQPSTYGKEHAAAMFFMLLSFYALVRGINKKSLVFLVTASVLLAVSITIRESMLVLTPFFFWFYFRPRVFFRPFRLVLSETATETKSVAAAVLPFLVIFVLIFWAYLRRQIVTMTTINEPGGTYFIGIFRSVFELAFPDLFLSLPFLVFVSGIAGFLKMLKERKYFLLSFLFSWFMLIFYFGNLGSYCARYLDIVVLPLYLSATYFLSWLYRRNRLTILIVILLVLDMFFFMYPLLEYRHVRNGSKEMALYVKNNTESNSVIISGDDAPFIKYYSQRRVIAWPLLKDKKQIKEFTEFLKSYLRNNIAIYIVEPPLEQTFFKEFNRVLFDNFKVKFIGQILTEDYHRPELLIILWNFRLFRLELKES